MAIWPASLPQKPLQQGYNETTADITIRTSMDAGPAKVRRRFSAGVSPYALEFLLTSAQVDTLKTFYTSTLLGGSLSFTMDHPRTLVSGDWRFTAVPSISAAGGNYYNCSLTLELLP